MEIFETCHKINDLLILNNEIEARNELIKLLDFHKKKQIPYSHLINHLIRESGLYPYLDLETSSWQDRFVYEIFKVNVGETEELTLHREQSALLKKLLAGTNLAVSAPTSFGKSFIIDAFISIKKPSNVVIIVPTIALTDETRRRLFKKFANEYKIITTTEVELGDKNIFIFPQERAINYVDKIENLDILIVDEFYKASSNFDKSRAPTLIKAILKLGKVAKQKYFLAPNISRIEDNPFTKDMEFYPLDFNTVYLEQKKLYEELKGDIELKNKKLLEIIKSKNTKTLIYAGTYTNIDKLSNLLNENLDNKNVKLLDSFSDWLSVNYDNNWDLTNLVKKGIGIHNGRLHRSLSQIQIKLFEEDEAIDNLLSTSSIIEGVNTSAENVIIWSNKNGKENINDFTYKNIMGRGGRMFRHFIGKIYILEQPPSADQTQLEIPLPEEILGDIDEIKYEKELTKEQITKIICYKEEMANLLGKEVYKKLQSENIFQSSDSELIKKIAKDMIENPKEWNGLSFLNSSNTKHWGSILFKIIKIVPSGWDAKYSIIVGFVKILKNNWSSSIPELLNELKKYKTKVGVDDFFKLERNVTYKLASLVNDINILQKEILKDKNYDISSFVNGCSNAFLPRNVFQLEEFGLPRMISKKIHNSKIYDFNKDDINIHQVLNDLNNISLTRILEIPTLMEFEKYILEYFFNGIKVN